MPLAFFFIMGKILNFVFTQAMANGEIKGVTMSRGEQIYILYISVLMINTTLMLVGDEVNVNRKVDLKNYFM